VFLTCSQMSGLSTSLGIATSIFLNRAVEDIAVVLPGATREFILINEVRPCLAVERGKFVVVTAPCCGISNWAVRNSTVSSCTNKMLPIRGYVQYTMTVTVIENRLLFEEKYFSKLTF